MGWERRASFMSLIIYLLSFDPNVYAKSISSLMKPSLFSIIQSGNDSFASSKSSCIFPPRDLFDAHSPYRSTCVDISISEDKDVLMMQNLNNSICLALRFISAKLCTNEMHIQNFTSMPLTAENIVKSTAQSNVESFCKEFEKSVKLKVEDSLPEIDTFLKSFFGKQNPNDVNYCPQVCNGTTTNVSVACALTNIGFEMFQSMNNTVKSAMPEGGRNNQAPANQTVNNTHNEKGAGLRPQSQVLSVSPGHESSTEAHMKNSPFGNSSKTNNISPSPPEVESDKASDAKAQKQPVQPVQQSNPVETKPTPSVSVSKSARPDFPNRVSTEPSISEGKSKISVANGKESGNEDKDGLDDVDDGALGTFEERPGGVEQDSSENTVPDKGQANNPLKQKPAASSAAQDNLDGTVINQQRKDNAVFKGTGDPNFIFSEGSDQESSGYFGYFITFIGICGLCFIMFHNKKRLIALVVEGRKPRGGRRRSGTGSGAAAYRKLENNFE